MSNPDRPSPSPEETGSVNNQPSESATPVETSQASEKPAASPQELHEGYERQREEALSDDNRWFASQHFGRPVADEDELMMYYIANGGAVGFRQRKEARDQEQQKQAE